MHARVYRMNSITVNKKFMDTMQDEKERHTVVQERISDSN